MDWPIAAKMLLLGEISGNGIVPLLDWITQDRLVADLDARGIRVVVRSEGREWHTFDEWGNLTQ
jgi:hypothetical protein